MSAAGGRGNIMLNYHPSTKKAASLCKQRWMMMMGFVVAAGRTK
jgi:hypothetical protein